MSVELIATIIIAVVGAGGPIVAWINQRASEKIPITTTQAETTNLEKSLEDSGIAQRWQSYADAMEERLSEDIQKCRARISQLERHSQEVEDQRDKAEFRSRVLDKYAAELRRHIEAELPPPPPEWPAALRRLSSS